MKNILLCIVLTFCLCTNFAFAKRKHINASATITAVSPTSITVKTGTVSQTYKVSANTLVHVDGRKAALNELHKNMHAEVTVSQLDPTAVSAIEARNGH